MKSGGRPLQLILGMECLALLSVMAASTYLVTGRGIGRATAAVMRQDNDVTMILSACGSNNPFVAVARPIGANDGDEAVSILALHDTEGDLARPDIASGIPLGFRKALGSVYGLAFDARTWNLYAASAHVMDVDYGSAGTGAIYGIDLQTKSVSLYRNIDGGPIRSRVAPPRFEISEAMRWSGKTSLGDIDIDAVGRRLFAVNLHERRIYGFGLDDAMQDTVFAIGGQGADWYPNARPWGLAWYDGWLYHGVVDSREDPSLAGSLNAYVYRSRGDGTDMQEVLAFDLNYARRPRWIPWTSQPAPNRFNVQTEVEPLITDLEFDAKSNMVVGLANRWDQSYGFSAGNGDALLARRAGDSRWEVEQRDTFRDELKPDAPYEAFDESLFGSLAALPGRNRIAITGSYALSGVDGPSIQTAVKWYDIGTGAVSGAYEGIEHVGIDPNRIGDIEILCDVKDIATRTPIPTESPTGTFTPDETRTPTASSTLTLTSTPSSKIYLPVAARQSCASTGIRQEIVLAIDASTSMRLDTGYGRSKLAAVQEAAKEFINRLFAGNPPGLAIAIVGFNRTAWVQSPLSNDARALTLEVDRIDQHVAEGTRIDLGLRAAGGLMSSGDVDQHPNRQTALILLTDGLPNGVPTPFPTGDSDTTIVTEAERLAARGITVYAIGVGRSDSGDPNARINPQLLIRIAGSPQRYFETPDAERVVDIYLDLARQFVCP